MITQQYNSQSVELLSTHFPQRNEANFAWGNVMSFLLQLPYLTGLWNFALRSGAPELLDLSGNDHRLTNTNAYQTLLYSLAPYLSMGGAGGVRRADEADLDITPDISLGGWFWCNAYAAQPAVISKWGGAGQRSYMLWVDAAGLPNFSVTTDGTTIVTATHVSSLAVNSWNFVFATKSGAASMDVYLNDSKVQKLAGVPAAIFNSNADLELGGAAASTANLLTGRLAYLTLGSFYLPEYLVWALYELTRPLFGV